MSDDKEPRVNLNESVDIALKDFKGKVIMLFPRAIPHVVFEPQSAFNIAEQLARCAHAARFPGERLPNDFSYLANQVKQRLTEDMRDRIQIRIATMLPSLLERKDLNYIAKQLIDTIFSALDDESYTRLEPRGGVKYPH